MIKEYSNFGPSWYIDNKHNKWDMRYFSEKEAEYESTKLINCHCCENCINCKKCIN